jgi:hypothetical protein
MPDLEFDLKRSLKVIDYLISEKVTHDFLYVFNVKDMHICSRFAVTAH